ncbi:MAG: hypothetical protein Q7U91_13360 [Sideroxyarcus sp.]|nr:hypothetical protein [Sideroxyarcus sp.]
MSKYLIPLLLACLLPAAQADELGRLFFTPQQRQQLEYQTTNGSGDSTDETTRNYIIVNGVVQKQGGKRTVWVNGTAQEDGRSNGKNPASASVTPPGKPNSVRLKVGQRLLIAPAAPEENQ